MDNKKKSYIFLLIGALLISFSPVLIKAADVAGGATVFYRLLIGSLVLVGPFIYSRIKSNDKLPTKGIAIAVLAGLSLAIDMAFWAEGIMASNAAMPTLVGNLAPLWVGIGAFFIFKERQNKQFWMGLAIAFIGVAFLMLRDLYFPSGIFKGLVLGLLAGIFYAIFMLLTQSGRKLLNTLSFLFISTTATAFFLGIFMLFQGIEFTGYSTKAWTLFIIMGVAIQAGAWFLINYAQGYLPASLVAPTLLAQPVLAGVIAYFILGESLGVYHILGGLIVVAGIYMVHFAKQKKGAK